MPNNTTLQKENQNSLVSNVAIIIIAVISISPFLGTPVIIGALADGYGLSETQVGYYSALSMTGSIIAAILVSLCAHKINQRAVLLTSVLVAVGCYIATSKVQDFTSLMAISVMTGIAAGTLYSLCLALVAGTQNASRNFSILMFSQSIFSGLELFLLPKVFDQFGTSGVFLSISLFFSLLIPLVFLVSNRNKLEEPSKINNPVQQQPVNDKASSISPWIFLSSIFFFYLGVSSFWTYAERLGVHIGFSSEAFSVYLSVGILLVLLGCAIAYWVSKYMELTKPLVTAMAIVSIAFAMIASGYSQSVFLLGMFSFFLMWNFIDILQLGNLSKIDNNGHYVALVPAFQAIGLALGPAISAFVLDSSWTLADVMALNSVSVGVSLACLILAFSMLGQSRKKQTLSPSLN